MKLQGRGTPTYYPRALTPNITLQRFLSFSRIKSHRHSRSHLLLCIISLEVPETSLEGESFKQRKHSIKLWRKTSVLRQPIDSCHVDNRINPSPNRQKAHAIHLRQKPLDKSSRHSPLLPLLPSCRTSISATQIAGVERFRRRKSSRRALCFLLWGCAVLCLPKIPPHHIT